MYTGYVRDITDRVERERELRASRARIVAAADEARRRLERDLHDGAQSRLLALGLELKVLDDGRLASVREELRLATDELRELARGIHPAVLTELGLIPALRTLTRRAPLPVALSYDSEQRCPAAVEAAAYFLVAEALTNVARYANATRAEVRVDPTARWRSRSPTTAPAAPTRPPAPGCAGWPTGWPRSTARSSSTARPAAARACEG